MSRLRATFLSKILFIIIFTISLSTINAQIEKDTLLASQYFKKGDSLSTEGSNTNAIEFYQKSQVLFQKAGSWKKVASCYNKISHVQKLNSDFEKSLKNANRALEICYQHLQKNNSQEAHAYDNIGHYYEQSNSDFKIASEYFNKALKIRSKIFPKNHGDVALSHDNIGDIYQKKGVSVKALKNYKKALNIRINTFGANHRITSGSYEKIGMAYRSQGKYQETLLNYNKSLKIKSSNYRSDHVKMATVYGKLGQINLIISNYEKAEYYLKKELEIRINNNNNSKNIADSYYKLGILYDHLNSYNLSKEYYQKASKLYIELLGENSPRLAATYYNLGILYYRMGFNDISIPYIRKTLEIYLKKKKNHPNVGKFYNTLGVLYTEKGSYKKALQYLKKSSDVSTLTLGKDHNQTSSAYHNISLIHRYNENYDQALLYNRKALQIRINNFEDNHPKIAESHIQSGDLYLDKRQYQKALDNYEYALSIYLKKHGNNHSKIAHTLDKIGILKREMKILKEALQYFQRSLEIRKKLYTENNKFIAVSYNEIAQTYIDSGAYQKALNNFKKAWVVNSKNKTDTHDKSSFILNTYLDSNVFLATLQGQAKTYKNLYLKGKHINDLKNTVSNYQKIDTLINSIRQSFTNYQDKVVFAKQAKEIYKNAITTQLLLHSVQKDQQSLENAFYYAEKSKANTLKELLTATNATNYTGLPTKLITLEKNLKINSSFYQSKITEEQSKQKIDSIKVTLFENKLFESNRTQDSLTQVLEKNYPKYYDFKYKNDVVSVTDIQQKLNNTTTLLEFFTVDSVTYAFTISKNDITVKKIVTPMLTKQVESFRESITSKNIQNFKTKADSLYKTLLSPIRDQIKGNQLIIIPDGPLWHLNFDLLLTKNEASNNPANLSYLLKDFVISYGNSANLLFTPFKNTKQFKKSEECLAFSFSDSSQASNVMNMNTLREATDDLPGTREEIKAISNIIDGKYFYGSQAVESNFKKNANHYKILHLALHGEVDNQRPENSHLFFTKSKDTIEDNLLYAHELFALNISAELTVLSACNTGFGKIAKGEGIMSLGNAFQYAGTKSLLLTSWEVSDQTTPELMKYFYANLKEGMKKSKALQQAKLQYLSTANINRTHPFYWGGFYLVGDSAPIQFSDETSIYWTVGTLVILGILLMLFFYRKKSIKR